MKKLHIIWTAMALLSALSGMAQHDTFQTGTKASIEPLDLGISQQKTTNLIFPYAIKSVDRGSAQVLVQKAKGVENVLQLKAGGPGFEQTNLSVITGDGLLYSFLLHYAAEPTTLNLELVNRPMGYQPIAIFSTLEDNQQKIMNASQRVAEKQRTTKRPRNGKGGAAMELRGIYIKEQVLYFQLGLSNDGSIGLDVEQIRLFVRDRKSGRRTASQEIEQVPLHVHGNATVVHGGSEQVLVLALEKFTIPDKKELVIQLMEKRGGRHLSVRIGGRQLAGATVLD